MLLFQTQAVMFQTKTCWRFYLSSFILFCCLILPAQAESSAKDSSTTNGYPEGFGKLLMENCIKTGKSQGAPEDLIESQCYCFISRLQTEISFENMAAMAEQSHKSGKPSPQIESISQGCRAGK